MASLDPFHNFLMSIMNESNNSLNNNINGEPGTSDELSEHTASVDNISNIANGSIPSASPDEEVIRSRGRKPVRPLPSRNHHYSSNTSKDGSVNRREQLVLALATRKSPRKLPGPLVDYASYFFRSPTPKKTSQKTSTTPKKEPSPSVLKARANFRKRLSLSSYDPLSSSASSSSTGSSSSASSPSTSLNGDSSQPRCPKRSCIRETSSIRRESSSSS